MNQNKLVSITINAYNSEKYIAETLNSVINQSYKNLQIIVVDDASTDDTAKIVKSFDDPRIELYTLEKNGHISNANNECYRKVRGEYMVHIDSDDIMLPDLVEKTVGFLEANPQYGACFCRPTIIDQNSEVVEDEYLKTVFTCNAKTQAEFVRLFFDSSNHLLHPGATIRKSAIDEIGFHDLSLCYLHDFDYWTRLVLKYPICVLNEFLIKYRMDTSGSHNSDLSDAKTIAHNTEYARIVYNMVNNCPDDLFLEAFSDRLKFSGEHTHDEIELEKAFILQDALIVLPQNKILSILKFVELFRNKKYVELARDKFGFTIRDFYKLQTSEIFYNQAKTDEFNSKIGCLNNIISEKDNHITNLDAIIEGQGNHISNLDAIVDGKDNHIKNLDAIIEGKDTHIKNLDAIIEGQGNHITNLDEIISAKDNHISNLDVIIADKDTHITNLGVIINDKDNHIVALDNIILERNTDIASKDAHIANLDMALNAAQQQLEKTIEYKIKKFARTIKTILKALKHVNSLKNKDGKKYHKSVMLYGFYGMNLGDDLFFEKLIKRYPNTLFLVYCFEYYRPFFEQFENVKFYAFEESMVQNVNKIGNKFKIHDLFEWLLLKRSHATVHIGGSIYQQIGDYELDYKLRIRRKQSFKPFFSISCNFGAFKTEEFKLKWRKQFKKFKDICFRDKYSYNLFSDLGSVRYAPDLLFSYKADNVQTVDGSVVISVFNPFASHRDHSEDVCNAYLDALAKTICDLVNNNQNVTLLGFCSFEGDGAFLHDLLNKLPDEVRQKVSADNYSFENKDKIINAIASAEYIIGTRLHSVILGLVMGKKVLPIAYNPKIHCILDDIGYDQEVVELNDITNYSQIGLCDLLKDAQPFDVSKYTNSDDLQFAKLDKFFK